MFMSEYWFEFHLYVISFLFLYVNKPRIQMWKLKMYFYVYEMTKVIICWGYNDNKFFLAGFAY